MIELGFDEEWEFSFIEGLVVRMGDYCEYPPPAAPHDVDPDVFIDDGDD